MLLLGHRGARRYAPENTVRAFDLALEHGCDGFEFDVRLTTDGQAVVCHDPKYLGYEVGRSSYERLCSADSSLPLFGDVVRRFSPLAFLYIELKVPGLEQIVLEHLRRFRPERGFVVASFLPEVLRGVHEREAGCAIQIEHRTRLGLICGDSRQLAQWGALPLHYVMPKYSLVSRELVTELHSAGKQVLVWTVNGEREMLRMADAGVDGVVSDDTLALTRTLGGLRKRVG